MASRIEWVWVRVLWGPEAVVHRGRQRYGGPTRCGLSTWHGEIGGYEIGSWVDRRLLNPHLIVECRRCFR
jgi:hypothetical protein